MGAGEATPQFQRKLAGLSRSATTCWNPPGLNCSHVSEKRKNNRSVRKFAFHSAKATNLVRKMPERPIGKVDHIGIAVKSAAEARKFFEGALGAHFLYEHANPDAGYRIFEFDLNGFVLELLEPLGEESFLHAFLEKHGEGVHHLTLDVPGAKAEITELKRQGIRIVDEREFGPDSYEGFISPRSSHGVLIQIGSGYPTLARAAEWFEKK